MGKKHQSAFEVLIEIASYLPWWVSILLAMISYFIFHYFAIQDIVVPITGMKDVEGMQQAIGFTFIKTIAFCMQFLFPMAFTVGAIISVFKRNN